MDECHKLLTNKVDLSNPEGHQILRNIYEPLPLGGPPGQVLRVNANMTSVRSMASLTGGLGGRNSISQQHQHQKSSTICPKTDKTVFNTKASSTWDKETGDQRIMWETYSSDRKLPNNRSPMNILIGMQAAILQRRLYDRP
ncbi:hypothetical protein Tco_1022043 [Tanacetum coccineum]